MKFAYTGPSWAASSYPLNANSTNLAKEWGIPFVDCSFPASNVLKCVEQVNLSPSLPIVWIYNEPLLCLTEATGLTYAQLLKRSDWKEIHEECNQYCLEKIAGLNRPVLLFGGHCDIVNCNHSNVIVGHPSWQKFLAQKAQMNIDNGKVFVKMDDGGNFSVEHCWGGEVLHRFMHENPNIEPSVEITNAVWDVFFFWKELEKSNLFFDVHPNFQGNTLFAQETKTTVENFLEEIK